jgi:YegS/Rv2252/BmrU family lipid kinase
MTIVLDRKLEKAALTEEIKASRGAVLVVNTLSRRGAHSYSEAKRQLEKAGLTLAAFPVRHPERIHEIVREAIAQGHKFIIIGGGDGTISSVVDHFAHMRVVFGVLPLGTANSFARTLGIPLNLTGAIDVLINGKVADVDLGKINDDYFANGSSVGMPAVVGRATPPALKRWLGRAAYALVAVSKFTRYRSFRCIVAVGDRKMCFDALDIKIASGGYQGGVLVASEANPDNGEILVQVLKGKSKWAIAKEWARLALHAPLRPGSIQEFRAPELRIDAIPKQYVAIDGEVIAQTPIQISVARNALLLMVPGAYREFEDRTNSDMSRIAFSS